jgi:hypothetical protein
MKRSLISLSVLILAIMVPTSLLAATNPPPPKTLLLNLDLVLRTGLVQTTLTVYNNGASILTQRDPDAPDGEICEAQASPESVLALRNVMRSVKALTLPGTPVIPNSARITVNYFEAVGRTARTLGNTFGYSRTVGPYLTIDDEFSRFIADNFSDCE